MTVVNLRGTHGSGKSTVVRKILDKFPHEAVYGSSGKRPLGYVVSLPNSTKLYVVGPYHTACGGCDALHPFDTILSELCEAYDTYPHILFEGASVSGSYGRVGAMMEEFVDPVFAFLDTPLDLCLARITMRRACKWAESGKSGQPAPVNPDIPTRKFRETANTKKQLVKLGSCIRDVDISFKQPVTQVMRLFGIKMRQEP